jgi:hypothetical protein
MDRLESVVNRYRGGRWAGLDRPLELTEQLKVMDKKAADRQSQLKARQLTNLLVS